MATRKPSRLHVSEETLELDGVDSIVSQVGTKLQKLRKSNNLSLQQLALQSEVSAAAINKIEHSSMVPTITTLLKLGAALGVPVSYFVDEDTTNPEPVHLTKVNDRPEIYTSHKGLTLNGLTGSYGIFKAAGATAQVSPGANSGRKPLKHAGEELVHVLKGEMTFHVGQQVFRLKKGDSLHFSGSLQHHWENPSQLVTELIWIVLRNGS